MSSDELGAHVLELPYKGGDVSMFVVLPPFNKQRGIGLLTKRLNTNILQDIVSSGEWRSRPVEVSIPKFSIEQSMDNLVPVSGRNVPFEPQNRSLGAGVSQIAAYV